MDMTEVNGTNKVEEHDHMTNHRLGEEGMNMVEGHYHLTNHRLEVENTYMVGIHMVDMVEERPSNHRPVVESINREDSDMGEDTTVEVDVVEREHEGVVLARHWTDDGVERYWRARREWDELVKSGCLEDHIIFVSRDSNCLTWHRVEKGEEESEKGMKCVWNALKQWGYL
jgi:hypothetical protein